MIIIWVTLQKNNVGRTFFLMIPSRKVTGEETEVGVKRDY